ncbi:MAG: serine/threonine-protein kinase [Polyangiaceae bacterium]
MTVPDSPRISGQTPEDTAPSARSLNGYVCPKCQMRFGEGQGQVVPSHCPNDGSPLQLMKHWAETQQDPLIGRVLDNRFTILAKLGAGSMGTVYRARQANMEREVAIKILRSDRALDEAAKARFLREARANSLLASPHTVTVFDFGQSASGELFLAMELLEGESLGARITRMKRLPLAMAIDTACQALRSLSEAHAKGIVHRDLKPDNIFYAHVMHGESDDEIVKVLDFGIAKMLGEGQAPLNAVETQAGTVFGTPRYMSPEQAQAKPLDARSDLYSIGVLLYHMLTGRPPFTDDDAIIVMARHIKNAPRLMTEVAPDAFIPPEIEQAVQRALAKDPDKRASNSDMMAQELAAALEGGGAITSGVRVSLTGPPRSSRRGSTRPAPMPLPEQYSDLSGPLPLDVADPDESMPINTLPTGAFAQQNATKKIVGVLVLIALVVVAVAVFASRPSSQTSNATAASSGSGSQTPAGAALTGAISTATTTAATAVATDSPSLVPTVDVNSLPASQQHGSGVHNPQNSSNSQSNSAGNHHHGHAAPPASSAAAPAPSSTNRYGILD